MIWILILIGVGLLLLVYFSVTGFFSWRRNIPEHLTDAIFIQNRNGKLILHAPKIKSYYRLLLGEAEYAKVCRQMESKVLHWEPILNEAQDLINDGGRENDHIQPVNFTLYYPRQAPAGAWEEFILYLHIESAIAEVEARIQNGHPDASDGNAAFMDIPPSWLRPGTPLIIVPQAEGLEFRPEHQEIRWDEPVNKISFHCAGNPAPAGRRIRGTVSAFVGLVEIGVVPFEVMILAPTGEEVSVGMAERRKRQELAHTRVRMHERICPVFDTGDREVTGNLLLALIATGDNHLIDCLRLATGEIWDDSRKSLIENADVLQIFWSRNASRSASVQRQWRYGMEKHAQRRRPLVRPVAWEENPPPLPRDLMPSSLSHVPLRGR